MSSIVINGNFYKDSNGNRWLPHGLCYQPMDGQDPISDDNLTTITNLLAEGGNWKKLNINALRVYQVDPSKSHTQVMSLLAEHNIHVIVGCVNSSIALPRDGNYPCAVLDHCKKVVDAFSQFDNVLGFSVSNELMDAEGQQSTAAAAKALVRDVKAHIEKEHTSAKKTRKIPVGLALRDNPSYTYPGSKYYACGDATDRADFILYNVYCWCGGSGNNPSDYSGQITAYYDKYEQFKDFPVPVTFGEYGCVMTDPSTGNPVPRNWAMVPYLFGLNELQPSDSPGTSVNMTDAIQGGFAFRYFERNQHLGLINEDTGNPTSYGGFADLCDQYGTLLHPPTGEEFPPTEGTPNSGTQTCSVWPGSSFDPTPPANCGSNHQPGGGIQVTLENNIAGKNIALSAQATGSSTWNNIATMNAGAAAIQVTIPTGTAKLMVICNATSDWPSACQIQDATTLVAGDTISALWVGNGTGACPVSS